MMVQYCEVPTLRDVRRGALRGGVAQRVARLTRDRWIPISREFEPHQRPPVVSFSKKLYYNCLVLVGSRNGFERDLHKPKNACFTSLVLEYKTFPQTFLITTSTSQSVKSLF